MRLTDRGMAAFALVGQLLGLAIVVLVFVERLAGVTA
jgi:hypothetical protein